MADPLRVLSHLPEPLVARAAREVPGIHIDVVPERGPLAAGVVGDVLLTQAWGSPNMAQVLERGVRWVHTFGTGVDRFPFAALAGRPLTCSRGASATPISEWVLAVMLAAAKNLPDSWVREPPAHWNFARLGRLASQTLGLVGIGGIGQAVACRALAFDMRVLALRRSDAPSPVPGVEIVPDLETLLAAADHLVLAAPATPQTRALLDASAFAHAKPGLHLVNIARGALVDADALRAALDDGRVARASLDVVEPEPLPAGHWLYSHPQVRLSPHISWSDPEALDGLLDPFIENLHHFLADEPLVHVVDPNLGY